MSSQDLAQTVSSGNVLELEQTILFHLIVELLQATKRIPEH